MNAKPAKFNDYSLWADAAAGAIRTIFGLVWAIDAFFNGSRTSSIITWATSQASSVDSRSG